MFLLKCIVFYKNQYYCISNINIICIDFEINLIFITIRIANPEHNEILSDVFSLGLVCLEMATLRSIQVCLKFKLILIFIFLKGVYDWQTNLILEDKVEKLIF